MHALLLFGWLAACGTPTVHQPMAHIGERIVFSDAEFVVDSAVDRGPTLFTTDGASSVTSTGHYVDVHFTAKNLTTTVQSTPFNPLLVDADGHSYGGITVGIAKLYLDRGAREYRWHNLQPGEELSFQAIYDVTDPAARRLHLELHGANPDEMRKVALGLSP